jgi:hypothetical protein
VAVFLAMAIAEATGAPLKLRLLDTDRAIGKEFVFQ